MLRVCDVSGNCMKKVIFTPFVFLALAGCATIVRGTTQTVAINTPGVTGATCTLTSASVGTSSVTTPATVTLAKGNSSIQIRCSKECYDDGVGTLPSNFEGMAAGNVLLGGPIGLGVDAASGAMNQYAPQADIAMKPNASCAAPATKSKKR
jgi:hypothetical protein